MKPNSKTLFNQLVENALEFLTRSITEFEKSPKYSAHQLLYFN